MDHIKTAILKHVDLELDPKLYSKIPSGEEEEVQCMLHSCNLIIIIIINIVWIIMNDHG